MRSVTWNRSETVRGSESEEAAVRDCFFFFIFSEGRTYSPLARRASGGTLPLVVSCAPPESVAFSGGADNAASRHCPSSGQQKPFAPA